MSQEMSREDAHRVAGGQEQAGHGEAVAAVVPPAAKDPEGGGWIGFFGGFRWRGAPPAPGVLQEPFDC
jgi:hypothetical protein